MFIINNQRNDMRWTNERTNELLCFVWCEQELISKLFAWNCSTQAKSFPKWFLNDIDDTMFWFGLVWMNTEHFISFGIWGIYEIEIWIRKYSTKFWQLILTPIEKWKLKSDKCVTKPCRVPELKAKKRGRDRQGYRERGKNQESKKWTSTQMWLFDRLFCSFPRFSFSTKKRNCTEIRSETLYILTDFISLFSLSQTSSCNFCLYIKEFFITVLGIDDADACVQILCIYIEKMCSDDRWHIWMVFLS